MGTIFLKGALLGIALTGLASGANAADKDFPMSVNSSNAGESAAVAPASGLTARSGKDTVTLRIHNTCFPTNLRGVGNPLARTSIVDADVSLIIGGKNYDFKVKYPGALVGEAGLKDTANPAPMDSSLYTIPGGGSAAIFGNTIVLNTPIPSSVSVDAEGNVIPSAKGDVVLKSSSFSQVVNCDDKAKIYGSAGHSQNKATTACGEFMGKDGPITTSFGGISVSADRSVIDMNVAFPGETGFCGGYWSPLMVFFDDKLPRFDNSSDFPLNPGGRTMWPEAGAPGFFVAIDRDGSGKIDQKDELFGDNAHEVNGFEVLKKFDTNKDGVIDHKDKDFKKLVLWQDKNGDGISQANELIYLHKKITKISLNYKKGDVQPIGLYAEAREHAEFWYKEGKKIKKGRIIDIWLAPAETRLSQK